MSSATGARPDIKPAPVRDQPGSDEPPPRIVVQYPTPSVDGGRYPAKRCVGDTVSVEADVFSDGHDLLRAAIRYRAQAEETWREAEMRRIDAHIDGVRWAGSFEVDRTGRFEYTIEGWIDVFGTWRDEFERKLGAGHAISAASCRRASSSWPPRLRSRVGAKAPTSP